MLCHEIGFFNKIWAWTDLEVLLAVVVVCTGWHLSVLKMIFDVSLIWLQVFYKSDTFT